MVFVCFCTFGNCLQLIVWSSKLVWRNHHFGIQAHQKSTFKRIKFINSLMIISFHNFYSIWKALGEALGSFQEARRRTFGLKMEVRRQVPLVLRAIFQHQAPHHLSNVPPWSQNKLKIVPKFIPRLFRSEILGQSEPEILRKSIQNRSNIHHTCMSGFNFSFA